jgi:hypothetical protein
MTRRVDPWLAGVILVVAVSLRRFVAGPFMGDDDYVLHNLEALGPTMVRSRDRVAQQEAAAWLASLLAGVDAGVPVVQVGQSSCEYSLSFHANGRDVWPLVPPTTGGDAPPVASPRRADRRGAGAGG